MSSRIVWATQRDLGYQPFFPIKATRFGHYKSGFNKLEQNKKNPYKQGKKRVKEKVKETHKDAMIHTHTNTEIL